LSTRLELYRKSRVLLSEAEKDLEAGCYNKAVSAAYFSLRLAAESTLGIKTKRDDKIANAVRRLLEAKIGPREAKEAWRKYMKLFDSRKLADHRGKLYTREEAEACIKTAKELRKLILQEP